MRISELIAELKAIRVDYGDVGVAQNVFSYAGSACQMPMSARPTSRATTHTLTMCDMSYASKGLLNQL